MHEVMPLPQLMPPGVEPTLPVLLRTRSTGTWIGVKVAEMEVADWRVTLQTLFVALGQSVQLEKLQPTAGLAVSLTGVPQSKLASQLLPQSTPEGSDVTAPEPVV